MPIAKSRVVGAFDAKNRLGHLLDEVEQGVVIVITRHGAPVARLVPYEESFDRLAASQAVAAIRKLRKGNRLPKGMSIRDLIEQGRR